LCDTVGPSIQFLAKLEEVKIPSPIRTKFANELKFVDTSSKKVEDAEDVEYSTLIRTTVTRISFVISAMDYNLTDAQYDW
jgi:hypothetical protein